MNSNPSEKTAAASLTMTDREVMETVHRQQQRLKWLTALAIALWSLAVVTSVGVLTAYWFFYAPKERQIMADYGAYGHLRDSNPPAPGGEPSVNRPPTPAEKALGLQFTMSYVMTKALLIVALSVVILSCGTLATLLLVIFNRRVTLRQINHSLAQISGQLKALQTAQSAP